MKIKVDTSEVIQEFSLIESQASSLNSLIIDRLSAEFMNNLKSLAKSQLKSTYPEYIRALYYNKISDSEAVIGLSSRQSKLAVMLEAGASPFDMKKGFEKSPKTKAKKGGGWYLTIPFRHASTGALAASASLASALPKEVMAAAKKQTRLTPSTIPKPYHKRGERAAIKTPTGNIPKYKHKFSIYAGLQKTNIGAQGEKRSSYMTFRRVSDASDALSWIHKGFAPRNFLKKAKERLDINAIVDKAVDDFLNKTI